jgi:hypothetical protein
VLLSPRNWRRLAARQVASYALTETTAQAIREMPTDAAEPPKDPWNRVDLVALAVRIPAQTRTGTAVRRRSLADDGRSELQEKALALVLRETVPLVEAEGLRVAWLHFKVDRVSPERLSQLAGRTQKRFSDTLLALRRLHVEFIQPGGAAAVLERERKRDLDDSDDLVVNRRHKDPTEIGSGEKIGDGALEGGSRGVERVIFELTPQELYHARLIRRSRTADRDRFHDVLSPCRARETLLRPSTSV